MKANEIERFLRQENIYCDCYEENERVTIELEGDWKHEHLRMKWLLTEKGYNVIKTYVDDSEDDFYFARYTVWKSA